MTDYFITATGSDGADGLSEATAWRTPMRARSQPFQPGDRVLLRFGDQFQLDQGAISPYSAPLGGVTFDAFGDSTKAYPVITQAAGGFAALELSRPSVTFRRLQVYAAKNGAVISNASNARIEQMVISAKLGHGIALWITAGPSPNATIKDNQLYDCAGSGINLTTQPGLTCSYNKVERCCADTTCQPGDLDLNYTAGIKVFGCTGTPLGTVTLQGNHCLNNGNTVQEQAGVVGITKGTGIWIDTCDTGAVQCLDNLCHDNTNSGILVENCNGQMIEDNRCYRNAAGRPVDPNAGADRAGIALFRGCNRASVRHNILWDNPLQLALFGYPNVGAEGLPQDCLANVLEENTMLVRLGRLDIACNGAIDMTKQVLVNNLTEAL